MPEDVVRDRVLAIAKDLPIDNEAFVREMLIQVEAQAGPRIAAYLAEVLTRR